MKIQQKSKPIVVAQNDGTIKITHHQTVRQSMNYNSAEASYGAEIVVSNNPAEIKFAISRLENIVEESLASKFEEHRTLLKTLSK